MEGIETIAGVISIKFHLQKLASRFQLCPLALPASHLIRTLIDDPSNLSTKPLPHSINMLTNHQKTITKDFLINSNNKLYGVFLSFFPLYLELFLSFRIVDNFPD